MLRAWRWGESGPPRVLRGHAAAVLSVALLDDGRMLASADARSQVRLWDLGEGRERAAFAGSRLAASADRRWLVSTSTEGLLRWRCLDGAILLGLAKARRPKALPWPSIGSAVAASVPDIDTTVP